MSMFDTVYMNRRTYQTKDFDCMMDEYEVISNRLFFRQYDYEWVDDGEHFLGGYLETTFLGLAEVTDYTGAIEMYDDKSTVFCVFNDGVLIHLYDNTHGRFRSLNQYLSYNFYFALREVTKKEISS